MSELINLLKWYSKNGFLIFRFAAAARHLSIWNKKKYIYIYTFSLIGDDWFGARKMCVIHSVEVHLIAANDSLSLSLSMYTRMLIGLSKLYLMNLSDYRYDKFSFLLSFHFSRQRQWQADIEKQPNQLGDCCFSVFSRICVQQLLQYSLNWYK